MILSPLHNYFGLNNEIKQNKGFLYGEDEGGIYEVLRIESGIPLFLEDHLDRFYHSGELAGRIIRFSENEVRDLLKMLIEKNGVLEGNVLISCKTNLKAFFIAHNYPAREMYKTGVNCGILKAEREKPNAKVFQTSVRQLANQMLEENGFYEVLLVDKSNHLTEGSRSNLFFVSGNELFTPPGKEVLLGITRQKTIQLAIDNKIPFTEKEIGLNELSQFEAAFLTGTSPKILPVRQIGKRRFNPSNPIVQQLIKSYDEMIQKYIKDNSSKY